MIIESFEQRILRATEGHWLYNSKADSITKIVYLGKESDNDWIEITEEYREKILAEKENEDYY